MQIDGHHALTYLAARFGGLTPEQAEVVAYAAQYVDEATNDTPVCFDNGAMYQRIASAHKMLDYDNLPQLANHLSWVPFHFFPGNGEFQNRQQSMRFVHKLICAADSHSSRALLEHVRAFKGQPYGLHWLGIALHVYADTFSHQGFAGISHEVNEVHDLTSESDSGFDGYFQRIGDNAASWLVSNFLPLGHGAALSMPDLPFLRFSYRDGMGRDIRRDNSKIFTHAVDQMCRVVQCYVNDIPIQEMDAQLGLPASARNEINKQILLLTDEDGDVRHRQWLQLLADDAFGLGAESLQFATEGPQSWKFKARGKAYSHGGTLLYHYQEKFLTSDWKYFHDGLKYIRLFVVGSLLPGYGICVA